MILAPEAISVWTRKLGLDFVETWANELILFHLGTISQWLDGDIVPR